MKRKKKLNLLSGERRTDFRYLRQHLAEKGYLIFTPSKRYRRSQLDFVAYHKRDHDFFLVRNTPRGVGVRLYRFLTGNKTGARKLKSLVRTHLYIGVELPTQEDHAPFNLIVKKEHGELMFVKPRNLIRVRHAPKHL